MFKKTDILFYKEAASLSLVIALSLSLIVIIVRITTYTTLIFASSDSVVTISFIFLYLLPIVLTTILPISIFTGCTLIATRMAADKEMDALFSFGMSVRQILSAPILFGLMSIFLILLNSFYYEPYAREQFRFFRWFQARQIAESFIVNNFHEKSFISNFPLVDNNKIVFYTDSMSKTNTFHNVFMSFEKDHTIHDFLVAKKGELTKTIVDGYPDFIISFNNVSIYSTNSALTQFQQINFSLLNAFGEKLKSVEDFQDVPRLASFVDDAKAICVAICTFFFPLLGMCLGLLNTRLKTYKIYAGIGIIVVLFYSLLSICRMIVDQFGISPFFVYPFPPFIFLILTLFLARARHKVQ